MNWYALLDVGGTSIKRQIVDAKGNISGKAISMPSLADRDAESIIRNIATIIMGNEAEKPKAVAMAFPGPFDYKKGISHMYGLGKYDSLYGKQIRPMLQKIIGNIPIVFMNDVDAFANGAALVFQEAGKGRCLAIAIGTGCGSAFMEAGKILKNRSGLPENGWIYNQSFKCKCIDDYISARGQSELSKKYFKKDIPGKELDDLAAADNEQALALFEEFGENLFAALLPFLEEFQPDTLILGGMISRSFRFFGNRIREYTGQKHINVIVTEDTSSLIHMGLFQLIRGEINAG